MRQAVAVARASHADADFGNGLHAGMGEALDTLPGQCAGMAV
ncbi:hypothetical protein [Rhodopila globiformis]|nr:hypothetical protein [Rhodopila globiformis]